MFLAPTEELEEVIVNFCLNDLEIPFGEFWYEWFSSSRVEKTGNHSIHINTNNKLTNLKDLFKKLPFVQNIYKITEIDMVKINMAEGNFKYKYHIHFKSDIFYETRILKV
jgi:hypothetical protein